MSIFSPRSSGHDHAHARPARPDAGADRVDAVGVRDDRDLRPVARLARDVDDLDQPVGDLGDLELEQLLDQLRAAARDDDARSLGARRDLGDDRLHAHAVVVALAVDLLGLGEQRLDALAQLHERVARVGLLDDPRDHLADAVLVLLEHHVALGLADALEDHLLGGLRGDPAEVGRRDVAAGDLVLVLGQLLGVDLRLLGLAQLARLGIDRALLLDRLLDELLLELRREDQLEHAEVGRARGPCRRARTWRRPASSCRRRAARPRARASASRTRCPSRSRASERPRRSPCSRGPPRSAARIARGSRFERRMRSCGIPTCPTRRPARRPRRRRPTSSPLKSERPSISSRVRTRTRRPRKRR